MGWGIWMGRGRYRWGVRVINRVADMARGYGLAHLG